MASIVVGLLLALTPVIVYVDDDYYYRLSISESIVTTTQPTLYSTSIATGDSCIIGATILYFTTWLRTWTRIIVRGRCFRLSTPIF